jgi:hypothetical protein
MRWNYKGHRYSSLGSDALSDNKMGIRDFLGRLDRAIQVNHGPVTSKTQLFLTKYGFSKRWLMIVRILTLYLSINGYGDPGISLLFGLLIRLILIPG